MRDNNALIRKKFIVFLVFILVLTPFVFIFLKYNPALLDNKRQISKLEDELSSAKKEIQTLENQLSGSKKEVQRLETQIYDSQVKEKREISNARGEIDTLKRTIGNIKDKQGNGSESHINIYNEELLRNSVQVHFHPGEFTQVDDILYVSGSNEKGFAVIDISDPDEIKPLGFFKYKHKGRIAQLDLAPSKNGDFIIMADPESGIYKIDTRDFSNMKIVSSFPIYTAHRVILSNDNKIAFAMTYNGLVSFDVQNEIVKLGEFSAKVDLIGDSYVDKENFHAHLMINLNWIANGDLQFISSYKILYMTYGGAYIFDVMDPKNIKCIKQNLGNKSSPWKMRISKDGTMAYYVELKKFVIFDINNFAPKKTFGENYYFLYEDFGMLETAGLFYFRTKLKVSDNYESEAIQLVDTNNKVLKTYLLPQAYASHVAISDDKQKFFVGFLGGRRYYVSAVDIR